MSFSVTFPSQSSSSSSITIGAIITSVAKGSAVRPPQSNVWTRLKLVAGRNSQLSRQVSGPPSGAPASGAHFGGSGRHLPLSSITPPMHPPSGEPASEFWPSAYSQYSFAAQSLESLHVAPGVAHFWKVQTWL